MLTILLENQRFLQKIRFLTNKDHKIKQNTQNRKFRFLQLGCGSGVIGLSLAKFLVNNKIQFQGQMIDLQPKAIQLSQLNLKLNELPQESIKIRLKDMIYLLQTQTPSYFQNFDLLISNPPYISVRQYNDRTFQKQVKKYESKIALIGNQKINQDGLYYVEKIIEAIKRCDPSKRPSVVIEYGGEDLTYLDQQIEKSVISDYYQKRRFIFWL